MQSEFISLKKFTKIVRTYRRKAYQLSKFIKRLQLKTQEFE